MDSIPHSNSSGYVADDDLPRRVEAVELTADFRKDHRVENGVERFALLRVGKDQLAELSRGRGRAPENTPSPNARRISGQRGAAVGGQCAGNRVRIDDETTLLPEILADGAFPQAMEPVKPIFIDVLREAGYVGNVGDLPSAPPETQVRPSNFGIK